MTATGVAAWFDKFSPLANSQGLFNATALAAYSTQEAIL